jgi:hypothetical protein
MRLELPNHLLHVAIAKWQVRHPSHRGEKEGPADCWSELWLSTGALRIATT